MLAQDLPNDRANHESESQGRPIGPWSALGIGLVAGCLLTFGAFYLMAYAPAASDRDAFQASLNQLRNAYEMLQRNYTAATNMYSDQKAKIIEQNNDFLLFLLTKAATVAGDKQTRTSLAEFGVIKSALSAAAAVATIFELPAQHTSLCGNATANSAFNITEPIRANHTSTCNSYQAAMPAVSAFQSGLIQLGDLQAALNGLFMSIVELDNAISEDP